ncbi:MAG: GNAT family N-acetyltransferase [Chitinophagaceae bacterium]|jgi:predicted GNAT family N-acyltransferase|nr:GNAT family N-acetyltransferase [Chitinophagaceae bacterium]
MALQIIDYGSPEYKQMVELRYQLLRKPLGLQFDENELAWESDDILIGMFEDSRLKGCCILHKMDDDTVKLRQMAVLNGLQGKGIGRAILQFAENIARDRGYKKMNMHARDIVTGFYEKSGYKKVGDLFIEVTIPHYMMEKQL